MKTPRSRLSRPSDGPATLWVDDRPFLMLAGEAHNSAAGGPAVLERACRRARQLHANTLLVPISWEAVEPEEGRWDFESVDRILTTARRHELRLVPLWFGAFKNTWSTYAPAWVKRDTQRFPRCQVRPGRPVGALSALSPEAVQADARAFAQVMLHIAQSDDDGIVVMVQVQNEVGILGAERDHAPLAERAFRSPPPTDFLTALRREAALLPPDVPPGWSERARDGVEWEAVFGPAAAEVFTAWTFARYVQTVAAAGRTQWDLPMFANAWLVQVPGEPAGGYPSGGPVARMAAVWRAAAPALDVLAPDIYTADFASVAAEYAFAGNTLLVPEARRDRGAAACALHAFGRHAAIGFAPFGIESMADDAEPDATALIHPGGSAVTHAHRDGDPAATTDAAPPSAAAQRLTQTYRLLAGLGDAFHTARSAGRLTGALQRFGESGAVVSLGGCRLRFHWTGQTGAAGFLGGVLAFSPRDGEFFLIGTEFRLELCPPQGQDGAVEWLELWEGEFIDGAWTPICRLNGDEFTVAPGRRPRAYRLLVHPAP